MKRLIFILLIFVLLASCSINKEITSHKESYSIQRITEDKFIVQQTVDFYGGKSEKEKYLLKSISNNFNLCILSEKNTLKCKKLSFESLENWIPDYIEDQNEKNKIKATTPRVNKNNSFTK